MSISRAMNIWAVLTALVEFGCGQRVETRCYDTRQGDGFLAEKQFSLRRYQLSIFTIDLHP